MTPADVRDRLIAALRTDLVGPALADEILNEIPTRWYLTGGGVRVVGQLHRSRPGTQYRSRGVAAGPGPGGTTGTAFRGADRGGNVAGTALWRR